MDQEFLAEIARTSGPEAAAETMRQFGWTAAPQTQMTDEARIAEILAANPQLAAIVDRFAKRLASAESEGNSMQQPATQQTTDQPTPQQTGRIKLPVLRTSTDAFRERSEDETIEQAWLDDGCPVLRHYDCQRGWIDVAVTFGPTTADHLAGIRSELHELRNGVFSIVERPISAPVAPAQSSEDYSSLQREPLLPLRDSRTGRDAVKLLEVTFNVKRKYRTAEDWRRHALAFVSKGKGDTSKEAEYRAFLECCEKRDGRVCVRTGAFLAWFSRFKLPESQARSAMPTVGVDHE
jgi:hypothetical protein